MSGGYGSKNRGRATRLHSLVVRSRAVCERCGDTKGPWHAAHVFPRRRVVTRTDETMAWCLCPSCHRIVDGCPYEFMQLVEKTFGVDAYLVKRDKVNSNTKVWKDKDWALEAERLKSILDGQ